MPNLRTVSEIEPPGRSASSKRASFCSTVNRLRRPFSKGSIVNPTSIPDASFEVSGRNGGYIRCLRFLTCSSPLVCVFAGAAVLKTLCFQPLLVAAPDDASVTLEVFHGYGCHVASARLVLGSTGSTPAQPEPILQVRASDHPPPWRPRPLETLLHQRRLGHKQPYRAPPEGHRRGREHVARKPGRSRNESTPPQPPLVPSMPLLGLFELSVRIHATTTHLDQIEDFAHHDPGPGRKVVAPQLRASDAPPSALQDSLASTNKALAATRAIGALRLA